MITSAISLVTALLGLLIAHVKHLRNQIKRGDSQIKELKEDRDKRVNKLEAEIDVKDKKLEDLLNRASHRDIANILDAIEKRVTKLEDKLR